MAQGTNIIPPPWHFCRIYIPAEDGVVEDVEDSAKVQKDETTEEVINEEDASCVNGEILDSVVVVATEEVANDDKTDSVTDVGFDLELVSETQDVGE